MKFSKYGIPASIALLVILVAVLARSLWLELRDLSTAGNENAQWTIFQLDTEFSTLHATLLEQASLATPDKGLIRLRTDILLSRIDIVSRGSAFDIFSSDPRSAVLLDEIDQFGSDAAALADGEITRSALERLIQITSEIRPVARELALLGVSVGAERTVARREAFSAQLRNTGLVAIAVIGMLAAVLVVLNRSLWLAREKDVALRASSARLTSTISASLDAIFTGNDRGEIVDVNKAAEKIFGWRREDVVGQNIENIILSRDAVGETSERATLGLDAGLSAYLDKGRVEIAAKRYGGESFPAEISVTSVSGSAGKTLVVYLRDISERKRSEMALIRAKERAEQTDRAKSQFLTVMSHEMRTPLNGILGVLDLLRTTKLSETQTRHVDIAAGSGEILLEQVNEALDITRVETGALVLSPSRCNLAAEIGRLTIALDPLAKEKGLDLVLEIDPDMTIDFVADGNRIRQIVTNLVGNAIKFTKKGSVTVSLSGVHSAEATETTVTVSDTGSGIPEEKIETIFEDFVMLSHTKGRFSRGDGLGLSISRKIARTMGGDITASSEMGVGSVFVLNLPLEPAPASPEDTSKTPSGEEHRTEHRVRQLEILAVEDNDINRSVLRELLEAMGHSVNDAKDGKVGWAEAMRNQFDLILMDISMPEMDGIELTQKIKGTDGPNQSTRIHGLTAYGEEEYREKALAAGMSGFSTKPVRLHDLARITRASALNPTKVETDTGGIDAGIVTELFETLGHKLIKGTADQFFTEMSHFLNETVELSLQNHSGEIAARLHKLGGAAALLGLRAVASGLEQARKAAEIGDPLSFEQAFDQLNVLVSDGRQQFAELIST